MKFFCISIESIKGIKVKHQALFWLSLDMFLSSSMYPSFRQESVNQAPQAKLSSFGSLYTSMHARPEGGPIRKTSSNSIVVKPDLQASVSSSTQSSHVASLSESSVRLIVQEVVAASAQEISNNFLKRIESIKKDHFVDIQFLKDKNKELVEHHKKLEKELQGFKNIVDVKLQEIQAVLERFALAISQLNRVGLRHNNLLSNDSVDRQISVLKTELAAVQEKINNKNL